MFHGRCKRHAGYPRYKRGQVRRGAEQQRGKRRRRAVFRAESEGMFYGRCKRHAGVSALQTRTSVRAGIERGLVFTGVANAMPGYPRCKRGQVRRGEGERGVVLRALQTPCRGIRVANAEKCCSVLWTLQMGTSVVRSYGRCKWGQMLAMASLRPEFGGAVED